MRRDGRLRSDETGGRGWTEVDSEKKRWAVLDRRRNWAKEGERLRRSYERKEVNTTEKRQY